MGLSFLLPKDYANASTNWDLNTSTDYIYDGDDIEFTGGAAQLLRNVPFSATGGTITTSGAYTIHTFTAGGTFTPNGTTDVEVLVVAGGGSGGGSTAGGGGAGGLIYDSSYSVSAGAMSVTVGNGGPQTLAQTSGNSGQNSVFGTLTAIGGGGGGFTSSASGGPGLNGGSGGGGAFYGGRSFAKGTGTNGQGNDGGTYGTDNYPGGGGGGAGATGSAPTGSKSGNGGIGISYSISGSDVYYAGGGGGGSQTSGGNGGLGGGGAGTSNGTTGTAGTANTGGGGGGGWYYANGVGGAGGSGVVVIRYLTDTYTCSTTSPTLTPNTGQGYVNVSAFSETLGGGSTGSIKYQVSPDDGLTWYWYTGGLWTVTSSGFAESNTAADINTHFADGSFNSVGSGSKTLKWRAYFNSDGSQLPKLDNISVDYVWDTVAPDNPTSLSSARSQSSGGSDITTNTWYNYTSPYFTWNAPDDNVGEGEEITGVAGYYIYFGTSNNADPTTAGTYQTGITYAPTPATNGTYYLFIETKDNAGNINHVNLDPEDPDTPLFIYKYEITDPTSSVYVTVSPSSYTRTNSFTFSWPTSGPDMAADTGGSGLAGYQYKINSGSWSASITGGSLALSDVATTGVNIFYLRAVDNASNYDETPVQTNFYFNNSAPTAVQNLTADPDTPSDENAFSFDWDIPLIYNGSISGYYYSVNALPTLSNTTYTTDDFLSSGPYATQQGVNTLYLVAKDEAGNYDFDSCSNITGNPNIDGCAKTTFTADTSAPGAPTGIQIFDISNRDSQEYASTMKWVTPVSQGAGFSGYEIYRSTNGTSYISIGTTSGTTYADTGLTSTLYYYYIKSKDNAGQYSVASSTVSLTPTGRYTTPPALTEGPEHDIKAYSATITWRTDRESSSFIEYGTSNNQLGEDNGGKTVGKLDNSLSHNIKIEGLQPETTYYYQSVWVDSDGNQGKSETKSFVTNARPKVTDIKISNITLSSAVISYATTSSTYTEIQYGKTSSYGGVVKEQSGSQTTNHSVTLNSLDHSSTYHFTIKGTDIDGNIIDIGAEFTFDTLSMPKIENLRFETVPDTSTTTLKVVWKSNVPATSQVIFKPQSGGGERTESRAELTVDHEIIIGDLVDSTVYSFVAEGRDQFGNEAVSEANTFTTPVDTRPPQVTNIMAETSNVAVGREDKAQIIVSWKTDEPTTSKVEYAEGISGKEYNLSTNEDATMTNSHLMVLPDLGGSSPYHFKVCSKDKGNNTTCSKDNTVVAGEAKKSIFTILTNLFKGSFGWLGKI